MGCLVIVLLMAIAGLLTGAAGAQGQLWALVALAMMVGFAVLRYYRDKANQSQHSPRHGKND